MTEDKGLRKGDVRSQSSRILLAIAVIVSTVLFTLGLSRTLREIGAVPSSSPDWYTRAGFLGLLLLTFLFFFGELFASLWKGSGKRAFYTIAGTLIAGLGLFIAAAIYDSSAGLATLAVGIAILLFVVFVLPQDTEQRREAFVGTPAQETHADFLTVLAEEVRSRWPDGSGRVAPDKVRSILREALVATARREPGVVILIPPPEGSEEAEREE